MISFLDLMNSYWSILYIFLIPYMISSFFVCYYLKKKKNFVARMIISLVVITILQIIPGYLFMLNYLVLETRSVSLGMAVFFLAFFICSLQLFICFDEPKMKLVYFAFICYAVQHLFSRIFSLGDSFVHLFAPDVDIRMLLPYHPLEFVPILPPILYFVFIKHGQSRSGQMVSKTNFVFSLVALLSVLLLSNATNTHSSESTVLTAICNSYSIMACFFILMVHHGVLEKSKIQQENEVLQTLWKQDKRQMQLAKENVEIINIKVHDLKHQLNVMLSNKEGISQEEIKEIEKSIKIYDSKAKTGNDAIDTLLTQKSLICDQRGITLTCMVDGSKLNFMSSSNIYSLFGNAVDNAIEAVSKIDDPDKKLISITGKCQGNIYTLSFWNYYSGDVEFKGGLPVTSKKDKLYHGFGSKSIKAIVDKYHGDMSIHANNGEYHINISFYL